MKILNYPIVHLAFWFIIGILLTRFFYISLEASTILLTISIIILITIEIFQNKNQKFIIGYSLTLFLTFMMLGIVITQIHDPKQIKNHYINYRNIFEKQHTIRATIIEKLKSGNKYDRYYAEINQIENNSIKGKVLLQIKRNSKNQEPKICQEILLFGKLIEVFKTNNPNQFDYANYLKTKGIYGQIFIDSKKIKLKNSYQKNINFYTSKYRDKILKSLENTNLSKENLALFMALLLGQQQDISNTTLKEFQGAGAIHILSVSGLHVGFILVFITFLLKALPSKLINNNIKIFLSISSLWLFAAAAGLSPSVIRSATMFSFIAIGQYLKNKSYTLHTTIVSLFIILTFEPNYIYDIGFQLSYLAVFFIIGLQPIFNSLYKPDSSILKYFWDILTVSFAAQLGTLPLSLYYFHQFPSLFFITNLIIIPLVSIIMLVSCLILIIIPFTLLPTFITSFLNIVLSLMTKIIHEISALEDFVFKEIPMSFTNMIIIYTLFLSCTIWLHYPSFKKIILILVTINTLQIYYMANNHSIRFEKEMIVFNSKNKTIVSKKNGQEITIYTRTPVEKNSFEESALNQYAVSNYAAIKKKLLLKNILQFERNKILIVDKKGIYNTRIHPDIILLIESPKINLDRLLKKHNPKILIADATNHKYLIDSWNQTCVKRNIPFHSIYEMGYYILKS